MLKKLFGIGQPKPKGSSNFADTEPLGIKTIQNLQAKDNKERESAPTHRIAIDSIATQRQHELEQLEEKMRGLDENSPEAKKVAGEIRLVKIHLAGLHGDGYRPLTSESTKEEIRAALESLRLNPPQADTQAEERAKATIADAEEEIERRITAANQIFAHHDFHEETTEAKKLKLKSEIQQQEMYIEYGSGKANKDTLKRLQDELAKIFDEEYTVDRIQNEKKAFMYKGLPGNGPDNFLKRANR